MSPTRPGSPARSRPGSAPSGTGSSSANRGCRYGGPVARYASVYPLVTARAVARPFTYEVPEETGKGAVVEVKFGNARRRGVVTEVGVAAPEGVVTSAVERVAETLPPALVDLALWVADYYGSTPARALALVAPYNAKRRGERSDAAALGALVAVCAPGRSLGVICVDEGHDPSYKQESDPRYDARTVAAKRAALEGAVAVFGSATPRPESWERLERLDLGGRIATPLPTVKVVDLRREAGYPLSAPLLAALGGIAERGGKAILLLNRRGVAPAIHCRACGATFRCPDCDAALVLHSDGRLRCHHCGHAEPEPSECTVCRSVEMARNG